MAAKANGLVDELGSLMYAIDLAVAKAGIRSVADVKVVEFPGTAGWLAIWDAFGFDLTAIGYECADLLRGRRKPGVRRAAA